MTNTEVNNETNDEKQIRWQAEEIDNYRVETVNTVRMMAAAMKNLVATEESQYCIKIETNKEHDCWRCAVLDSIEDIEKELKDPCIMLTQQ